MKNDLYSKRVKDVMCREVVSIHVGETLHEALAMMSENRVAALPVVDRRDHCVGMLSTSDLVDLTRDFDDSLERVDKADEVSRMWLIEQLGDRIGHERIDGLMTENVASVNLETPLPDAAREMLRNRVHRLPVLDQAERLVGIVSTMDILRAFADGS